ncbi:MAG TPA: hypothetical protein EYP14_01525, partial [Planctomycetaceae bacterium]|nr:hypothetical protein [Planctomycetaceae bacterium]
MHPGSGKSALRRYLVPAFVAFACVLCFRFRCQQADLVRATAGGHGACLAQAFGPFVVPTAGAACLPGAEQAQRDDRDAKGRQKKYIVIRQGGYVEKVPVGADYRKRIKRLAPKEPIDSLKTFHIIPGFRIELVAAEPLVRDPVALAFDENGRLFVAELTTYSLLREKRLGRVSMLEDTDGDGKFDRSTVFADKLEWPTGVLPFAGGLFVCSSPVLLYLKDSDGDGRADSRDVVLNGFDTSNPNQCPNSLRWSFDSRV